MDGGFSTLIKKKKVSGKVKVNQNGLFQNFFPPLSLPLFLLLFHSLSALWCSISVKREKGRCRFIRFRTNLKNAKAFLKLRFFPPFVSLLLRCATNCTLLIFSYNFSFLFFFGYFSPPLSFPLSTVSSFGRGRFGFRTESIPFS